MKPIVLRACLVSSHCIFWAAAACATERAALRFDRDIRPIFAEHCYRCHGPDRGSRQSDLRLDLRSSATTRLDSGQSAIVPGASQLSELVDRISSDDAGVRMPPPGCGERLSAEQIRRIRRWIDDGAPWDTHWSYVTPQEPPLPAVDHRSWPRSPIDRFTLAAMQRHRLRPAPAASPEQWIRRVTFDLVGLPPSLSEVDRFVASDRPDAKQRQLDRLLASPHYGERMATPWLDLARYADTHGYHSDSHRDMWRWRDWVVDAINDNLPFDRFTLWQLAGDLLPNATLEQRIATGFNRNHMINYEDGAIAEEYRTEYVADRVATTSTVWLGQTIHCVRCHDHKYDPYTRRDYFRLFAYFNNVPELGLDGQQGNAAPWIEAPTRGQLQQLERIARGLELVQRRLQQRAEAIGSVQKAWEKSIRRGSTRLPQPPADMLAHFPLDERRGTEVRDASPGGHRATAQGDAIWLPAAGRFGGALLLNERNYVDCGNLAALERDEPFSMGAWVFPTTGDRMALIARNSLREKQRGLGVYLHAGRVHVQLVHEHGDNQIHVQSDEVVRDNQWQHVLATYDGSSSADGIAIFVNGQQRPARVLSDQLDRTIITTQPLTIGRSGSSAPFRGMIDDVRIYARQLRPLEVGLLAGSNPVAEIVQLRPETRTQSQQELLRTYFLEQVDRQYGKLLEQRRSLERQRNQIQQAVPTTMIMRERKTRRPTHLLDRGDYRAKTDPVLPGTPAFLGPTLADAPATRLGLAQWLIHPEHPLTARVVVNRYWQLSYGAGLVRTPEDFGTRGQQPTHPELLDWLAVGLVRNQWDLKVLHRQLLLTATYRQSSEVDQETRAQDPQNRLLARASRFRLPAEMIRDQALALGNLLDRRIGGKSVFPYQPPGLWREVSYDPRDLTAQVFVPSRGSDLYRRSLYTFWKRAVPAPSLAILGAPNREVCLPQRAPADTPLDALVLLNDPAQVEAARGLAERMLRAAAASPRQRLRYGFRLATGRHPRGSELAVLLRVLAETRVRFGQHPQQAQQLIAVGQSEPDARVPVDQLAGYTVVASLLLNLYETITRS